MRRSIFIRSLVPEHRPVSRAADTLMLYACRPATVGQDTRVAKCFPDINPRPARWPTVVCGPQCYRPAGPRRSGDQRACERPLGWGTARRVADQFWPEMFFIINCRPAGWSTEHGGPRSGVHRSSAERLPPDRADPSDAFHNADGML